jgi:hypothetical protein
MWGCLALKSSSPLGAAVELKGFWASPQVLQRKVTGSFFWPAAGALPLPPGALQAVTASAAVPVAAAARTMRRVRLTRGRVWLGWAG